MNEKSNLFTWISCLAWLRGTRKNPPSFDETIIHETKREQLAQKVVHLQ